MKLFVSVISTVLLASSAFAADFFMAGDRCLTQDNQTAMVWAVFTNGKLQIQVDDEAGTRIVESASVSRAIPAFGDAYVGQMVLQNSTNQTGRIVELFTNGKAKVQIDFVAGTTILFLNELTLAQGPHF